ncbi:putative RNA-binding protein with PIN domain/putative nucleic acid-binding Zn-ribbon protein [Streptomonospora nanhaiensis]|uniref:Putative RNA-binding protein with PIN domain/putative nucleic acid-binding Zn-ribbon protein n=1 Tax=Streptomonospora nanhaiensis TaxID=1323731 RepID=A0A853BJR8_9ACTN|nr:NYN domain-containing protein [Streptomonospora nanhaiensis]NYI94944.1 putative RNA-binding protein with PIN domain/putative nucleic acid-binding Zn-ribbon protein [Streptomonospora nanhaiensis]
MSSENGVPASSAEDAGGGADRPLPEAVRARVIEYGSDVLGGLREADLPPVLRRVARFEPRRRARLAGPQIAAQLEADAGFRARVAERVEQVWPELAEGLRKGVVPPAADPVAVAAAAYLLRPEGWSDIVARIREELDRRDSVREADEAADTIAALRRQVEEARNEQRAEIERLRGELREYRSTVADLRRRLHGERQRAKAAVGKAEQAIAEAADRTATTTIQVNAVEAENRRLRNRLAAAEAQVENARRAARAGRSADEARLRVLLDVLLEAAHGLRRELALPTSIESPADLVSDLSRAGAAAPPGQGLPDDDPGLVDEVLSLPRAHLLVDGYNVTKTGYGTLPLADQRGRLLTALEGLASRTKAEITCVFDGADVGTPPALSATRRVRVLFSDPGETADELIVRLVRAEPHGRPLAVATSDKEIVTAVRREGARTLSSPLLLRRLGG